MIGRAYLASAGSEGFYSLTQRGRENLDPTHNIAVG